MIWLVAMVDEFAGADGFEDVEIDQIVERLAWTPRERLDYLLDMLAFEERAHRGRRIPAGCGRDVLRPDVDDHARGSPSTRWAMMLRCTSEVPA